MARAALSMLDFRRGIESELARSLLWSRRRPSAPGGGGGRCRAISSALAPWLQRRSTRCRRRPAQSVRKSPRPAGHVRWRGSSAEHAGGRGADQSRRDPRAAERADFARAEAGQLGALADADDAAVRNSIAALVITPYGFPGRTTIVATWQSVRRRSHMPKFFLEGVALARASVKRMHWPNLTDLPPSRAPVGLVGAPLGPGSVTSGRCDLAPALLRGRCGGSDVTTSKPGASWRPAIPDHGDAAMERTSRMQRPRSATVAASLSARPDPGSSAVTMR